MAKIAIFNQKGGVGKTTSVLNIAGALYRTNNPALMIDMDPQGHLSYIHPATTNSIAHSLFSYYQDNTPLSELVIDWHDLGSLIPAHGQLSKVDSIFGKGPTVLNKFSLGLAALENQTPYSNVLIDCCPYMGVLSLSALFTADLVIVPIASDFLSLQGALKVEKTLKAIEPFLKRSVNRRYLMTRFDRRRNMSYNVQAQAIEAFGDNVLKTVIFENVAIAESPNHKQDIFSFNAHSTGAANYMTLLEELIAQNLMNTHSPVNKESIKTIEELPRH